MQVTERMLITVKTYPAISSENIETVCTGAINEKGEWRRLYPVPFRYIDEEKQYKLFDIVDVELRAGKDNRPESRVPDVASIRRTGHIDGWEGRYEWIRPTIATSLQKFIESGRTIGPVRVSRVIEFVALPAPAAWTGKQLAKLEQNLLFDERKPLEKVPVEFRLRWQDGDDIEHDSLFIAWEVFQTYRSYRRDYADPVSVMRDKWLNDIFSDENDLSFFVGNMAGRRQVFMVCGTFQPPRSVTSNATLFSCH